MLLPLPEKLGAFCAVLLSFWLCPSHLWANVPFAPSTVDATAPFAASAQAWGDLDSDGELDVAVVGATGAVVWYAASDGVVRTLLGAGADVSEGIVATDLDGDTDIDLVLSNGSWLENPSTGGGDPIVDPWPVRIYGSGAGQSLVVASFNGDALLDIARRDAGGAVVRVYTQSAGANFTEAAQLLTPAGRGLAAALIDGDAAVDLVLGDRWFANPGDLAQAWNEFPFTANPATDSDFMVDTEDLNGDGRHDIAVAPIAGPGRERSIVWYEAPLDPRTEFFAKRIVLETTEAVHHSLITRDFDNDGVVDLLTARTADGTLPAHPPEITLHRNRGDGLTWDAMTVAEMPAFQLQPGDPDADGNLDFIASDPAALTITRFTNLGAVNGPIQWKSLSTDAGDLELPSLGGSQQTVSLIFDIDGDGLNDFVIAERTASPSVVWYQRTPFGWLRHVIDNDQLEIEAGGHFHDIDSDGDLDFALGGDSSSDEIWWWENPLPGDPTGLWNRHFIKNTGGNQHHDLIFDDFDGDGVVELVYWNQPAGLFIAEIPADPTAGPWPATLFYSRTELSEGLAAADVDGNGIVDVVGAGRWFEYQSPGNFIEHVVDPTMAFTRAAVGQLIPGGRPELAFVVGDANPGAGYDGTSRLRWYEWNGANWVIHEPLPFDTDQGHSFEIVDFNGDGHLDIFNAEMRLNGNNDAATRVFYGDSLGNFTVQEIATGTGNHESKVGDLDGDGDLDILGKPFQFGAPGLNIWVNDRIDPGLIRLDQWERFIVDPSQPWLAAQVVSGDFDGDGLMDIASGGWWYPNPGDYSLPWERRLIGPPLHNVALVYDFDGDGDPDMLGTPGQSQSPNHPGSVDLYWARNDGAGNFTILGNITPGNTTDVSGAFVQGIVVARFEPGGPMQVAISWNFGENGSSGVDMLTIPNDPSIDVWPLETIHPVSEGEELAVADLDGDGDLDLFQGAGWLRNEPAGWTRFTVTTQIGQLTPYDDADRVSLGDFDGDGDLDAMIGLLNENTFDPVDLVYLEHPADPTLEWPLHVIGGGLGGGFAMDVADMDNDGDPDVAFGEHVNDERLLIFENLDDSDVWRERTIDPGGPGIDHHDGAQTVDFDGDGDLDILSLGWWNQNVLFFENQALSPTDLVDTEPPTTPTNIQATAFASSRVDLTWDNSVDNIGIPTYDIYRDGALVGSTSDVFFSDTGLTELTQYMYRVVAVDTQENESLQSAPAIATTPAFESQPPSVPGNLAAEIGPARVALTWDASTDNVAVVEYRIYRDGALFATVPADDNYFVDETVVPSTGYLFAVTAADAEGNESDPLATTQNIDTDPPPTGLWGAWGFEGGGATAIDFSGLQNHGTLENSAVRSPNGYFGNALEAAGSAGNVDLGNLDIYSPEMTIMLWMNADDFGTRDARLLSKSSGPDEQLHWWMVSTTNGPHLRFRLRTQGVTTTLRATSSFISSNVWIHAAFTYDGSTMRIYQDGVEVASTPKSGAIDVDPNVIAWIAANPGEIKQVFDGRIDEVKIFGSALTPAEIQTEMAVAASDAPDPDAPTPPGGLAATTTTSSVDLSWIPADDNVGIESYRIERDGVEIGTTTSLSFTDTDLGSGLTFTYDVYAADFASNVSAAATVDATTDVPDTTPPSAPGLFAATGTSADAITLSYTAATDDTGVAGYRIRRDGVELGTTTDLFFIESGLEPDTLYPNYTVTAFDAASNESAPAGPESGTTLEDTEAPTAPGTPTIGTVTQSSIALRWTAATDNIGITSYDVLRGTAFVGSTAGLSFVDTELLADTPYSYTVVARDQAGNASPASGAVGATTLPVDNEAPSAPANVVVTVAGPSEVDLSWGPATDNVGVVEYNVYRDSEAVAVLSDTTLAYTDVGLMPDTMYTFEVTARDAAGNESDPLPTRQTVTTDDLAAFLIGAWSFDDESTPTAYDSSGLNHHGTLEAGAFRDAGGYFGETVALDGSAGRINLGAFDIGEPELTIMLWLNADNFGTSDARLISKSTGQQEDDHVWMISTLNGPHLRFRLRTDVGDTTTLVGNGGTLSAGTWIHAAATYDGTTMRLYQDGAEVGSVAKTGGVGVDPLVEAWIGANPGEPGQVFNGRLDEVKIFSRALSADEIQFEMERPLSGAPPVPALPVALLGLLAAGVLGSGVRQLRRTDRWRPRRTLRNG